ncbi:hypothetical protein AVEN_22435-1 [Araneus ventricosus]|uniref:Uncharacterized protein n=1 Tax=Araneus ventricosus TaxID=182803 RepID=A0A4Y2HHQ3_ARAVE|nr:hypothetical protein AVEN_22435-1 [Araneus ventricosus]
MARVIPHVYNRAIHSCLVRLQVIMLLLVSHPKTSLSSGICHQNPVSKIFVPSLLLCPFVATSYTKKSEVVLLFPSSPSQGQVFSIVPNCQDCQLPSENCHQTRYLPLHALQRSGQILLRARILILIESRFRQVFIMINNN